jgi:polyhydroxyalkanoate synthesis regulator phasin
MEFFQQIWSQALTTVHGAEEEAQKLLGRLQGMSQDEARKLSERLATQRKDLERRMDEVVKASVARLKVPRRDEVAQLNARLDALTRRLEGLTK